MPSTPSSTPSDDPDPGPSRRARWILAGVAVALVVVVGGITWIAVGSSDDGGSSAATVQQADVRDGGPQAGDPVPDFSATTLDGKTVKLSDYAGKPVVLNFWASWCNPCREEFPLFRQQLAKHAGDYVMLGVDNRDIESDARTFAGKQRATWPIVFDSSNAITKAYGASGLPQTLFIKRDGTVAVRYYSAIPDAAQFQKALAEITPAAGS